MKSPTDRYAYRVLQHGTLPLAPNGTRNFTLEHRCTSVLVWPADEQPSSQNTILTDPCFTPEGFQDALTQLNQCGISFSDIGYIFVTHPHHDHLLNLIQYVDRLACAAFRIKANRAFAPMKIVRCPGHSPRSRALVFQNPTSQNVWIVGDAILDEAWLRAWGYYWPNLYLAADIVQTWRTIANILTSADLIIPGHGQPIQVTPALLEHLLATFAAAEYADECQDVSESLRKRLEQLSRSVT